MPEMSQILDGLKIENVGLISGIFQSSIESGPGKMFCEQRIMRLPCQDILHKDDLSLAIPAPV